MHYSQLYKQVAEIVPLDVREKFSIEITFTPHKIKVTSKEKKLKLIQTLLSAAQASWEAGLLKEASDVYDRIARLLDNDIWKNEPVLALEICIALGKFREATEQYQEALKLCAIARGHGRTPIDRLKIGALEIRAYTALGEMLIAMEIGMGLLQELQLNRQTTGLPDRNLEGLAECPSLTNDFDLALLQYLRALVPPAYLAQPDLLPEIVFWQLDLCSKGNSIHAIDAYSIYSILLVASGDIETGYQYSQLALRLLTQFEDAQIRAVAFNAYNGYVRHWREPLVLCLDGLQETMRAGLSAFDLEFTSYAAANHCATLLAAGVDLNNAVQQMEYNIALIDRCGRHHTAAYGRAWLQLCLCLQGKLDDIDVEASEGNGTATFASFVARAQLAYWQGKPEISIRWAVQALSYLPSAAGLIAVAQHNFYHSLALLACFPEATNRTEILQQVEANQIQMSRWSKHAPMNFQHLYDLISAVLAALTGQKEDADNLFHQAIQGATDNGSAQENALANELTGQFYLQIGQAEIAKEHLIAAYSAFTHWGAIAISGQMVQKYECLASLQVNCSQEMCDRFAAGIPQEILLVLEMERIKIEYDPATEKIVLVARNRLIAGLIDPILVRLKNSAEADIILRVEESD